MRTPRGRVAGQIAYQHYGLALPKSIDQQGLFDT
jgi:Holliday junction resolvasome RuvABC ATP-dependent DNA helicase subunit